MIAIEINPALKETPAPELLEQAARAALERQAAAQDASLTIVLTDAAQLQELNHAYRGVEAPTDVLAFPAHETDPETGAPYLGDVLISMPHVAEQAGAGGHSCEAEAQLLVVHGVLHLLGYDHAEAGEKARMWAAQIEILERLGVSASIIRES